jgi:hypothetical protein
MRRPLLGLVVAMAIVAVWPSNRAHAQFGGTGYDTFSFYYGYYLPHQAAMAAQPTPLDTINQITAQRQYAAQTDRSTLYDPISPYGDVDDDPLTRYGKRGGERMAAVQRFSPAGRDGNARGTGPATFYNRTARYFPDMKSGRNANQNLAKLRGARGGMGGGMGMPSMPSPGPR